MHDFAQSRAADGIFSCYVIRRCLEEQDIMKRKLVSSRDPMETLPLWSITSTWGFLYSQRVSAIVQCKGRIRTQFIFSRTVAGVAAMFSVDLAEMVGLSEFVLWKTQSGRIAFKNDCNRNRMRSMPPLLLFDCLGPNNIVNDCPSAQCA